MIDLKRLFTYNGDTGDLIWKTRPPTDFKSVRSCKIWNTRYSGKVAGTKGNGRSGGPKAVNIVLAGGGLKAHRVIWELHCGPIPSGAVIDHINGNPFDNRLSNLRLASPSTNAMNARAHRDNASGMKGVSWRKSHSKWIAQISVKGKNKCLGYFGTKELAHDAYRRAALTHFGQYARTA